MWTNQTKKPAIRARERTVTQKDLPLSCPTRREALWNAHPRVYLTLDETRHASCPYCGTVFVLGTLDDAPSF